MLCDRCGEYIDINKMTDVKFDEEIDLSVSLFACSIAMKGQIRLKSCKMDDDLKYDAERFRHKSRLMDYEDEENFIRYFSSSNRPLSLFTKTTYLCPDCVASWLKWYRKEEKND